MILHRIIFKNKFANFLQNTGNYRYFLEFRVSKILNSINDILEKISIIQTMEKAHKVLEYCAAKSKDDVFQTSRVSKFFAEQTFKAIVLKISDNYSDVLSNSPLNQTCRQGFWVQKRLDFGSFGEKFS